MRFRVQLPRSRDAVHDDHDGSDRRVPPATRTMLALACALALAGVAGADAAGRRTPPARDGFPPQLARWMAARAAQGSAGWQVVDCPARGLLTDVDIVSPTEAWAVSMADAGEPGEILRYRDGTWRLVASDPAWLLWGVDAVSAEEVWIAGFEEAPMRALLFHLVDGGMQRVDATPCSVLFDVRIVAPADGWAVGSIVGSGGETACILRYRGERWERATVAARTTLIAVDLATPDEGWAIGTGGQTVRWHAGAWTEVPVPLGTDRGAYFDLELASATEGWAVGTRSDQALHLTGGAWQVADTGLTGRLFGVALADADSGWFVGAQGVGFNRALVARYAAGHWSLVPPSGDVPRLLDVSVAGADDGWAVGKTVLRLVAPPTPTPTGTSTPSVTSTATATDAPTPTVTPDGRSPSPAASTTPTATAAPSDHTVFLPSAGRA